MNTEKILSQLNPEQTEAVTTEAQHALVLAGAGSGKTRVLVHRIAWLLQAELVSPFSILAVTFTNKAAAEMRNRIAFMLKRDINSMWIGTFHGIALRILQINSEAAKLPNNFQILDADDQYRLIRRILSDLEIDEKQWPPRSIQGFINEQKNEGIRADEIDSFNDGNTETLIRIYQHYDDYCQRSGLVDFAEMLLRSHELLLNQPDILEKYQHRFSHILVDEFQDTNAIQSAFIRLLAGNKNSIMVVGDDDQSIYAWRGAKIDHMLQFNRLYPKAKAFKLEQNYRSTQVILDAANAVIANNSDRLGKNLWSAQDQGDLIHMCGAHSEYDEAVFIAETIKELLSQENSADEIAILYRSNAQSRVLEEALLKNDIPYQIYGGLRFFERLEIKDVLAYARLINSRHDDIGFERIINTPTRGLGLKTLNIIRNTAQLEQLSLWSATEKLLKQSTLSSRAHKSLNQFCELIHQIENEHQKTPLADLFTDIIELTELKNHYLKEPPEKAQTRLENLDELINATESFTPTEDDINMGLSPLAAFLAQVSLNSGDTEKADGPHIQLMTLHSAKGLEFPIVFICGMEQGLFPHGNALEDINKTQEERRLCYVGITRAEKRLYLSYATSRRIRGKITGCLPSQFLKEVPADLVRQLRGNVYRNRQFNFNSTAPKTNTYSSQQPDPSPYHIGQTVLHHSFGEGIITEITGKGDYLQILVHFSDVGPKILAAKFAQLEVLT